MSNEIIADAKAAVKGNWLRIIGTGILMCVLTFLLALLNIIPLLGQIAYVVGVFILSVGMLYYCYNVYNGGGKVTNLFVGFKNFKMSIKFLKIVGLYAIVVVIFTAITFVLTLIPVVGAILAPIASIFLLAFILNYVCVIYIIFDEPEIPIMEGLRKSKEITKGHRWTFVWSHVRVVLVPLILAIISTIVISAGLASGLFANAIDPSELGTAAMGGVTAIIGGIGLCISGIIYLIKYPTICLVPASFYEHLKRLNGMSSGVTSEATPIVNNDMYDNVPQQ